MSNAEFSFDVFLSHNRAQKDWTRELARRLRTDGFKVWFDEWETIKHAGSNFIDLLAEGVEKSRKVVLIWSPEFFANEWPEFEASVVQQLDPVGRRGRVIPLLYSPCEIPTKWGFRQRLNFVDCAHGTHKFEYAYQVLAHNLDPARFVVPDSDRYLPEKAELAGKMRSLARMWRITGYASAIFAVLITIGLLADIAHGAISFPPREFGSFVEFNLSVVLIVVLIEMAVFSAVIARGLTRLRSWGRLAAIGLSLFLLFYPLSWYTLWIFFHTEDAKSFYAEISEDAR